jgi:hypothetical protein
MLLFTLFAAESRAMISRMSWFGSPDPQQAPKSHPNMILSYWRQQVFKNLLYIQLL